MTIRKRLSLYILAPLITTLLILSIFDYFYSSWFLEKKASLMLLSVAEAINNEIQQSIRHTESDLAMLLSNRMIKEYVMYSRLGLLDYAEDERWKIEEDFLKVAEEKSEYVSIRFVGLDGKSTIDIIDKRISYGHFDFSGEDWFDNALQLGKEESFVSPLHLCKEHNKPSISISRLYFDDAGEKCGIISLHVHTDKFFQRILGKTIGENGYAYLVDNRGLIVAHKEAAGTGVAVKEYESSKRAIAGDTGTITEFDEMNMALMKKAYMPLQIKGLSLVISRPMSEISIFGVQLQLLNLIFFISTVVFVSIISSIVAKRISKPIKELHRGIEIIETGNMDHSIEIKTGDEIEQMADSFNKMVAGLKEKTDELRESEEKLRAIFDNAMDGILVVDVEEKKFFTSNNMICKMLGYSMEEIRNLRVMDIHPEKDLPYIIDQFERQAKGEFTLARDITVTRKDGTVFYADINSSPVTLAGKTYLIGMFRDITERKRTEVVLRESENRYRTLFESANDAIFIMKDDLFIDCNQRTLEMFGCTRKQIINQPPYRFSPPMQPDDRKSVEKALEKIEAAYNGNPQFFEWKHQKYNGELFDAEVSLNSVELASGKYLQAIVRDVTDRKQAEQELERYRMHLEDLVKERTRELEEKTVKLESSEVALRYLLEDVNEIRADLEDANERLKELDRLKSMFIASMSHELRTPLNSIIGFTGLILQGMAGEINSEQRDQLRRVYGSAKHLLLLITDVIDISKIEVGEIEVFAEEFPLDKIVKEAVSSLRTQIDDKGLGFEVNVSPDIHLKTDRRRLLQCILNYSSNAVKFTERGAVRIKAKEIEDEKMKGNFVEISVSDTGIGIKEEDLPKLFDSFVRLDSPLKLTTSGTGLGLYLTKKLATEVLCGSVSVESSYGKGSTFMLKIPREIGTEA